MTPSYRQEDDWESMYDEEVNPPKSVSDRGLEQCKALSREWSAEYDEGY